MRPTEPPSIATWMLHHLLAGENREVLAGDLIEEFRSGRSDTWYWRQVLTAIATSGFQNVISHRTVLLFAALWSMLSPGWLLYTAQWEMRANLIGRMWSLEWPWSTICSFLLPIVVCLLFIWIGALIYLIPYISFTKNFSVRRFRRGLLLSLPMLIVTGTITITLGFLFPHTHFVNVRVVTPVNAISDLSLRTMLSRLPFFLTLLCMLWGTTSHLARKRTNSTV